MTAERIRRALDDIEQHYPATIVPVTRVTGSHAKTVAFAPLPISAHVLDARDLCRQRLGDWCYRIITDRKLRTPLTTSDVPAMVSLLRTHADLLGTHPQAVAQLEASAHELEAIAAPRRREWMRLGPCPLVYEVDGEPTPCMGTVRAYSGCDPYCDGCRVEAVVAWWERKMFPDVEPGRLVTAAEMITVIHREFGQVVKEPTIRQWVSRGFIETSGKDPAGHSLYDLGGVVYALARRSIINE